MSFLRTAIGVALIGLTVWLMYSVWMADGRVPTAGEWLAIVTALATGATLLGGIRLPTAPRPPPSAPLLTHASIGLPGPTVADSKKPHLNITAQNAAQRRWMVQFVEVFSVHGYRIAVGKAPVWLAQEQASEVGIPLQLASLESSLVSDAPAGATGYSSLVIPLESALNVIARVEVQMLAEHEGKHTHAVYSLSPTHDYQDPSDAIVASYYRNRHQSLLLDRAGAVFSTNPLASPHDPEKPLIVSIGNVDLLEELESWGPRIDRDR